MSRISTYISQNNLLPETLAYRARVIADGGIVYDINYTNALFVTLKNLNIYISGIIGISAKAGIKVVNGVVSKRYNLFGTNDEIPNSTGFDYYKDGLVTLNGAHGSKIINTTLPAYFDAFITGWYDAPWFITQNDVNAGVDGLFLQASSNRTWWVRRTSDNYAPGTANWGLNSCAVERFVYNASTKAYYLNKNIQSNGSVGGTTVSNSDVTADLQFARYNGSNYGKGLNKDIFIFSSLISASSVSFENFLYQRNIPTRNVNVLFDGDSQFATYLAATTNSIIELNPLLLSAGKFAFNNNVAVPGQNSTQLLSNFSTHLNLFYNSNISKNICIILIGVNDIAQSVAISTIQANINSAVALAIAKGYIVYVCTQRECNVTYATILSLNTSISSNAVANGYKVIDIANDPLWNFDGAHLNRTWYQSDNIHLTDATHLRFAQIIYSSIIGDL